MRNSSPERRTREQKLCHSARSRQINELTNEFLLLIAGALSILFGVLMFKNPSAGALSVVWLIGSYAIAYGIMLLTLAFKLKRLQQRRRPRKSKPFHTLYSLASAKELY